MVVAPRGELDMATVGAVERGAPAAGRSGRRAVVLDLGGLSFMDSSGLHLVARWTAEASRDGFEFQLEPGSPAVQRVFELAGMTDELPSAGRAGGSDPGDMHASVRRYKVRDIDALVDKVESEFVDQVKEIDGFVGYYVIDGGDGTAASVTVGETAEAVAESTRRAAGWVRDSAVRPRRGRRPR